MTRLERLGRSLRDLANIAHEIESSGASLRVLEQSVDSATSAGPQLRRSRYRGGTARIDPERVQMLKREGLGPAAIAASLAISRMSVYRGLKSNGIRK